MKKVSLITAIAVSVIIMSACGSKKPSAEEIKFAEEVNSFCDKIEEIDGLINGISPIEDDAAMEMLKYMDDLDTAFQAFAKLDFPKDYDYLESVADEAGSYMSEAVKYYHESYNNDAYNEYTAEYADENYARAYKRVKIIISFLHGEQPEGVSLSTDGK